MRSKRQLRRDREKVAAFEGRRDAASVTLALPCPPSVNGLIAIALAKRRVKSLPYVRWREEAGLLLEQQRPGRIPGRYSLDVAIRRGCTRADLGNLEKALSDLLVRHGIVQDDRYADCICLAWGPVEQGAEVLITVQVSTPAARPEEVAA